MEAIDLSVKCWPFVTPAGRPESLSSELAEGDDQFVAVF